MLKQNGVTLLEVLAAIFVVSIGLLGVLAVIPFGAYQVSKAQHAEYASNMLANATKEVFIRDMLNQSKWGPNQATTMADATKLTWFEPRDPLAPPKHIFHVLAPQWLEIMRGQDDLVYTLHDNKRPGFTGQGDKIQSTGKYTWFFTYLPQITDESLTDEFLKRALLEIITEHPSFAKLLQDFSNYLRGELQDIINNNPGATPAELQAIVTGNRVRWMGELRDAVDDSLASRSDLSGEQLKLALLKKMHKIPPLLDVLACYNRVPVEDVQVQPSNFASSNEGGTFTFSNPACLSQLVQTKYVFVTWELQRVKNPVKTIRCTVPASASAQTGGLSVTISVNVTYTSETFELDVADVDGAWCKIVFLDKGEASTPHQPRIFVKGELPTDLKNPQVYIPNGVLYHKRF